MSNGGGYNIIDLPAAFRREIYSWYGNEEIFVAKRKRDCFATLAMTSFQSSV